MSYGHYLGGDCDLIEPDLSVFDERGYPKRADELYHYMKENLFLKEHQFDYNAIPIEYLPYKQGG